MIKMKKTDFLCLVAFVATFSFAACNSNKEKTNDSAEEQKQEVVAQEGAVKHLDVDAFIDVVSEIDGVWNYKGDKPCIVDFYTTWCPPCKMLSPILDSLANEMNGIYVYKVDAEKNSRLSEYFKIEGVPTVIYVPMNGEPVKEVGYRSKAECIELVNKYLLNAGTDTIK